MSMNTDMVAFIPQQKFMRECPIAFIKDMPQANEVQNEAGYSSQAARLEFEALAKIGIKRAELLATYMMNFRPIEGELSALFWNKNLPLEGYVSWGKEKNVFIMDFAYNELCRVRDELQQSKTKFIIASGKWALYFLTGQTTYKDTAKSSYGTLLKWRASHLQLSDWWGLPDILVIPIIPLNCTFDLPDKQHISKIDQRRLERVAKAVLSDTNDYLKLFHRTENFLLPPDPNLPGIDFIAEKETFKFKLLSILHDLLSKAETMESPLWLATDVETMSFAFIDCIGIAWSGENAICIPYAISTAPHYWTENEELEILEVVYPLLTHPNVKHIGQNYQYDTQYYWRNLLMRCFPSFDTMVANHSMFSVMDKNLAFLSSLYCNIHRYWKDDGNTKKGATNSERWIYNMRDVCSTFEIAERQQEMYTKASPQMQDVLHNQLFNVLPDILSIMENGNDIDSILRDSLIVDLEHGAELLAHEFIAGIGEPININSSQQLKELFYNLFNCPKQWKKVVDDNGITKNTLTLDEDTLEQLWESEILIRPFIDILLDYKKLTKTASGLKALTLDVDRKLRCSYNVCGTDTYRFSSNSNAFGTGTNLQVISKGKKLRNGKPLPNSKQLFIPPPGYTRFDIDLDSADLRIVTAESGAKDLKQMFDEKLKPYIELMKEFYHDPTKNKHSPEYGMFKSLCHGTNYVGSAAGLAGRLGLLVHEVERIQKWYFGRNPEILQWHTKLERQVRKQQYIENAYGYRRWFFDLRMKTLMQTAAAWIPQSSVAILINSGMHRIIHEEPRIILRMQTHDSLMGDFPSHLPELKDRIVELCMNPVPYPEPLLIPVGIGVSNSSWGDIE